MATETNAERLVRIARHRHVEGTEEQEVFELVHDAARLDGEKAKRVLHILASWRTCGKCKHIGSQEHPDLGHLEDRCICGESHSFHMNVSQIKDTCGHWEEA